MKNIHVLPTDKEPVKGDLEKEMFELEQELNIPSNLRWHNSKPKQETLKEYDAESYLTGIKSDLAQDYWCKQQERMYSEEEVYDILIHHTIELFKKERITLLDFWNKFKKK